MFSDKPKAPVKKRRRLRLAAKRRIPGIIISMPSFAHPWILLLLPLAPLVAWWRWSRPRLALRFPDARVLAELPSGRSRLVRRLDAVLYSVATLSLLLALAGPRLPLPTPIETEGIELMLIVDVSGSMHEVDAEWAGQRVSRLNAAIQVFELFVLGGTSPGGQPLPGRPQDLIGLVTFANYPESIAPLTLSHTVLVQLLRLEQARKSEEGQTNIGDAVAEALLRLDDVKGRRKVLVLLSDGEHNFAGPKGSPTWLPRIAAQRAADLDATIYAIDTGGDDAGDAEMRAAGKLAMQEVARITGGKYFAAGDTSRLLEVCGEIDRLERRPIESFRYRRYREWHAAFGLSAFALLFAAGLIHWTLGRRLP